MTVATEEQAPVAVARQFPILKTIVSSAELGTRLKQLLPLVSTNVIIPILECVHIRVVGGECFLSVSDLRTNITTSIPAIGDDLVCVVPAHTLSKLVNSLPEQPVTLIYDENTNRFMVESSSGEYEFHSDSYLDYPKFITIEGQAISLNPESLRHGLNLNVYATSSDDLRPAMCAVLMQKTGFNLKLVATDGHRLVVAKYKVDAAGDFNKVLLPRSTARLLYSLLKKLAKSIKSVDLTIDKGGMKAKFTIGTYTVVTQLVDERFPDYENAIPVTSPIGMVIDRQLLIDALKRLQLFASQTTRQIVFSLTAKGLIITAENNDYNQKATEVIKGVDVVYDDHITLGFNARLLLESLQHIDSGMVSFHMSSPSHAVLIKPVKYRDKDVEFTTLVMPVMLNRYE